MHNLIKEIGLAPSELPFEALIKRISQERTRVQNAITDFLTNPTKTERKTKAPKKLSLSAKKKVEENQLKEMLKANLGISLEELIAGAKADDN